MDAVATQLQVVQLLAIRSLVAHLLAIDFVEFAGHEVGHQLEQQSKDGFVPKLRLLLEKGYKLLRNAYVDLIFTIIILAYIHSIIHHIIYIYSRFAKLFIFGANIYLYSNIYKIIKIPFTRRRPLKIYNQISK